MFEKLIRFSVEQAWLVLVAVLAMAAFGVYNYHHLPIDAVPDITNVQVQINTAAAGYSPLEVEQRITYPVEIAMAGLPRLEQTRSISRYGLSQVTVVFTEGTDIYFARQLINERLSQVTGDLPDGILPVMGPTATGLGEIYMWAVEAAPGALKADGTPYDAGDLREIQDWVVKPQLRTVPGVNDINTIGGFVKEFQVAPDPEKLRMYGLALADLVAALERNNANVGAGYIEKSGEQYLLRVPGQVSDMEDIRNIAIDTRQSVPIRIADVAEVLIGRELRSGAATENGEEVVLGTVFMLMGENSRTVARAVDQRIRGINRTLPPGVSVRTVYDRTVLIDKTINTVKSNLLEGALLVIAVLFVFLGNLRAAVITMLVIPLAMLFTFSGMVSNRVSANLMSLGALDFGIIIDGAVVIVENSIRRLAQAQSRGGRLLTRAERVDEICAAACETRKPLIYGQLIIMVVYLPIFSLSGVEGKMFHPMAFTVVSALIGAMLLSLTFVPAAISLFVRNHVAEKQSRLMPWAKRMYSSALDRASANRGLVFALALLVVFSSGLLASRLGSEFIPSLDEGDIALHAIRIPGTSLTQAVAMQHDLERAILQFPQVERVFSKIGTAEIASDPMPPSVADTYIMLKPRADWPNSRLSKADLVAQMQHALERVPGNSYEFTQPIQMRFNELISGVRSDIAVKVFGDDMTVLTGVAEQIAAILGSIQGGVDVKVEQTSGLPILTVNIDRDAIARLGLNMAEIQETVATALYGHTAGALFMGDRRFDIVVRLPESLRNDFEAIRRLPIRISSRTADASPAYLLLGEVASLDLVRSANEFSRENGKRLVVVSANVRGRDIGSYATEAQQRVEREARVPPGNWITWGGVFEQLESASTRLRLVIPLAFLLVLVLLYAVFNNLRDGLIVFTGIPFAMTGGIFALWLRGIPFSISAGIGFIALSGVAVLNGLVMISFIRNLRAEGMKLDQAVRSGVLSRLRPVLITALVASLGFIPMATAVGTGAEVQRPLATVVIGGILTSTVLTLLVLPLLYQWVYRKDNIASHQI